MRNVFNIYCGEKIFSAHNAVEKAFDHWCDGYAYAGYMALIGGEHKLYKETSLVSYNADIGAGELYATYKIELADGEFPYELSAIGFAPYDGAELSNRCEVTLSLDSAVIYGTVYLEIRGDFDILAGDNPLVKSLLGITPREKCEVRGSELVASGFEMLDFPADYDEVSCREYIGDGANTEFDVSGKVDFLVLYGGKPCARYCLARASAKEKTALASAEGGFFVPDAFELFGMTMRGEKTFALCHPTATGLRKAAEYEVPKGFELFCDPSLSYAGLKNGSEYKLVKDGKIIGGGTYEGKIVLCADGNVAEIFDGSVRFASGTAEFVSGDAEVLFRDGAYDIFVYAGDNLYFYTYDGTTKLQDTFIAPSGGELILLTDCAVAIRYEGVNYVYSHRGAETFFDQRLDGITERIENGCYYGNGYMGSFISSVRQNCTFSSGRFCVSDGSLYYVGENGSKALMPAFTFDGAVQAGNKALFLCGDKLVEYNIISDGIYASLPAIGDVRYTQKYCDPPKSGKVKLKLNKEAL